MFTRHYEKLSLVFWITPTYVKLEFLYITFGRILLLCNPFKLTDVTLRPYCRCLSKDCDDFAFNDVRVRNKFSISTSKPIIFDNPESLTTLDFSARCWNEILEQQFAGHSSYCACFFLHVGLEDTGPVCRGSRVVTPSMRISSRITP